MRKLFLSLLALSVLGLLLVSEVSAQDRTITIFLVRHAEKDSTVKENPNPPLSAVGEERAERLRKVMGGLGPNRIMSTDTLRTRATVEPIARQRKLAIEIYDPRKLPELAEFLRNLKKKRKVLVVGHSNTTAVLANLLFESKTFNNLDDSEYDKLFIIRMKKGRVRVEVRTF